MLQMRNLWCRRRRWDAFAPRDWPAPSNSSPSCIFTCRGCPHQPLPSYPPCSPTNAAGQQGKTVHGHSVMRAVQCHPCSIFTGTIALVSLGSHRNKGQRPGVDRVRVQCSQGPGSINSCQVSASTNFAVRVHLHARYLHSILSTILCKERTGQLQSAKKKAAMERWTPHTPN